MSLKRHKSYWANKPGYSSYYKLYNIDNKGENEGVGVHPVNGMANSLAHEKYLYHRINYRFDISASRLFLDQDIIC